MILGMQVTIPGPENLTMPEFQPLWAWIASGVAFVYAVAAVLFRVTGKGWQIYNQQVEGNKWREWANEKPDNGSWFCMEGGQYWWERQGDEAKKWAANEKKALSSIQNRWRYPTYCGFGDPPMLAVFSGLLISPIEYLVWHPLKNAAWIASLPFVGIANFAKGSPPKPKAEENKPMVTFQQAMEQMEQFFGVKKS